FYQWGNKIYFFGCLISIFILLVNLYNFVNKRFTEIDDFLESIKYRDFSRIFNEKSGDKNIQDLHKSCNEVIRTIEAWHSGKEIQRIYLRRILEMVDTGIIAYNQKSGHVLLVKSGFKETLDVPEFKNISSLEKRKPACYNQMCFQNHPET